MTDPGWGIRPDAVAFTPSNPAMALRVGAVMLRSRLAYTNLCTQGAPRSQLIALATPCVDGDTVDALRCKPEAKCSNLYTTGMFASDALADNQGTTDCASNLCVDGTDVLETHTVTATVRDQ